MSSTSPTANSVPDNNNLNLIVAKYKSLDSSSLLNLPDNVTLFGSSVAPSLLASHVLSYPNSAASTLANDAPQLLNDLNSYVKANLSSLLSSSVSSPPAASPSSPSTAAAIPNPTAILASLHSLHNMTGTSLSTVASSGGLLREKNERLKNLLSLKALVRDVAKARMSADR